MSHNNIKHGFLHYVVLFALLSAFTFVFYKFLIPSAVESAVVSLFGPHEHPLIKIDGVNVEPKDATIKTSKALKSGEKLKDQIKSEFIFDFTSKVRTEENDGYTKSASEFLLKAEPTGLGEKPIILEPPMAFFVLSLILGMIVTLVVTMFMPIGLGYMSLMFFREIGHTQTKVRLQTGFEDETVKFLSMPDEDLNNQDRAIAVANFRKVWERTNAQLDEKERRHLPSLDQVLTEETTLSDFRNEVLYSRIREAFSESVLSEITATRGGIEWSKNHLKVFKGLALYMTHHFTHVYSNNVTGAAYLGAAILIAVIGVRGLKFIPPTRPSLILAAISLEAFLLALLGIVLLYTSEEEPVDKMMKKVEDASRGQLETLKYQREDMHKIASALVEGSERIIQDRVKEAIVKYVTSDDKVRSEVADQVAKHVIVGLRSSLSSGEATK